MKDYAPKARFDAIAAVLKLDEPALDAIRYSINSLLPNLHELARMWDETLRDPCAAVVVGEMSKSEREALQSRLASFIMRTISCVYDDDFCDYADEFARDKQVPERLIPIALAVAAEFVTRQLCEKLEDRKQLTAALIAWNKLICTLGEFAR